MNRRAPRARRLRIPPEDQSLDMWGAITLGPVALPPVADLRAAFVRLVGLGAGYRLALKPADAAHWKVAAAELAARTDELVRVIPEPVDSVREWLLAHRVPDLPVQIGIAGDHLGFLVDHRLMDGALARELLPLLIATANGKDAAEPLDRLSARPLTEAFLHTLGANRKAWRGLITHLRAPRPWPEPTVVPARPDAPASADARPQAGACHRTIVLGPDALAGLRSWTGGRLALAPGLLMAASAALSEAGVAIAPHGLMICDLRRYLPKSRTYLGNFITAVRVPQAALLAEPRQVNSWLTQALVKGRPLAVATAAGVRSRLPLRRRPPASVPDPEAPVTVSISHHGTLTAIDSLDWLADPEQRSIEIVNDVLDADTVGLIAYESGGLLYLSASFRAERVPVPVMERALAALAHDPRSVLDSTRARLSRSPS